LSIHVTDIMVRRKSSNVVYGFCK